MAGVSYTNPADIQALSDQLLNMLVASPAYQPNVVQQLAALDAPTRTAVCAAMQASTAARGDTVTGQAAQSACATANAQPQQASMLGLGGAVVLGVAVTAALFWAIKK